MRAFVGTIYRDRASSTIVSCKAEPGLPALLSIGHKQRGLPRAASIAR